MEEQEKVFVNQATQVNAWDKLLITNGEKIVTLNQEVERVKIEQQQLEHELDYVVSYICISIILDTFDTMSTQN